MKTDKRSKDANYSTLDVDVDGEVDDAEDVGDEPSVDAEDRSDDGAREGEGDEAPQPLVGASGPQRIFTDEDIAIILRPFIDLNSLNYYNGTRYHENDLDDEAEDAEEDGDEDEHKDVHSDQEAQVVRSREKGSKDRKQSPRKDARTKERRLLREELRALQEDNRVLRASQAETQRLLQRLLQHFEEPTSSSKASSI